MGLVLSTIHTQELTLIEHLLVPGRVFSVIDIISWVFHPAHYASTEVLPFNSGGSRRENNLVKVKLAGLGAYNLCLVCMVCYFSGLTACPRGADPASYGHLNILDSVQVTSCCRQRLHSGLARISTFEVSGWGENLIPRNKLRALLDYVTLNKKQKGVDFFQPHSPIIFHLSCLLNLINCYYRTHPGKISAGQIYGWWISF